MAQELDDLEFWLPSEFLTDEELLTDFKTGPLRARRNDDFCCGYTNSFGFSSVLSSPVGSAMGTTETESDEDDFMTELSRKMAHSTLQDPRLSPDYTTKGSKLSGSPQSTLCGCKSVSRGSPNSVSGVCSPPDAKDAQGWDLLYAAAGEVAMMRMIKETSACYQNPGSAVFLPQQNPNPSLGIYPNYNQTQPSYQQFQAAQSQQMNQHQIMKNGVWGPGIAEYCQLQNGRRNGGGGRAQGLSMSAWPTLQQSQQQPGSGMTAVFLGESGAKKERVGTGVFMPRRFGSNPTETRNKPAGCSTVLLPDRVVHALKLNLVSVDEQVQPRGNGSFTTEYDAAMKHRINSTMAQQRRSLRPQPVMNQELRLPQEWTY